MANEIKRIILTEGAKIPDMQSVYVGERGAVIPKLQPVTSSSSQSSNSSTSNNSGSATSTTNSNSSETKQT